MKDEAETPKPRFRLNLDGIPDSAFSAIKNALPPTLDLPFQVTPSVGDVWRFPGHDGDLVVSAIKFVFDEDGFGAMQITLQIKDQ